MIGPELVAVPDALAGVAINAAVIPRELSFFTYTRGSTVAGAGGGAIIANAFHTNIPLPNALPRPKTFVCTGIRILVTPLDYASGAPAVEDLQGAAGLQNLDLIDDLTFLYHSTYFQMRQGEVEEVVGPSFLMPANSGIGGVSSVAVIANAADVQLTRLSIHTHGIGWSLKRRPVVLWNQQHFSAQLFCDWTTTPTIIQERYVFCILDGILGREYQG